MGHTSMGLAFAWLGRVIAALASTPVTSVPRVSAEITRNRAHSAAPVVVRLSAYISSMHNKHSGPQRPPYVLSVCNEGKCSEISLLTDPFATLLT